MKIFEAGRYNQIESAPDSQPAEGQAAPSGKARCREGARQKIIRLPVTGSPPEDHPSFSFPDLVLLVDPNEVPLAWIEEDEARRLIRLGQATFFGTRKKVRRVQLTPHGREEIRAEQAAAGWRPGKKYSHNRETEDNVSGCWTLVHISERDRDFFYRPANRPCSKAA